VRRLLLVLILLSIALVMATPVQAQSAPQFRNGFKALADLIPGVVGAPLEEEQIAPNGDILQRTTGGLMVWRKADRWNSFTDGSFTWILGPYGLQKRPNTELFAWEQPTPITLAPPQPASPSPAPTAPPMPAAPIVQPTLAPAPSPTPPPTQVYQPDVKAMDDESGGHGVMVKSFMQEVDQEWSRVWGWRPHRPTTVYLYFDGYRMANGASSILGLRVDPAVLDSFAANSAVVRGNDLQTGGWAILMNLSYRYGMDDWDDTTRSNLLMEYAHVMLMDLANDAGPQWFKEGFAQWSAYSKVWGTVSEKSHVHYAYSFYSTGRLPSLMALTTSWNDFLAASPENLEAAFGASYLAVKYLAGRVGGMPLLQTVQRVASGESFDSALQATTGYSVARLDGEYKSTIPSDQ